MISLLRVIWYNLISLICRQRVRFGTGGDDLKGCAGCEGEGVKTGGGWGGMGRVGERDKAERRGKGRVIKLGGEGRGE